MAMVTAGRRRWLVAEKVLLLLLLRWLPAA
jgi:hypothetical protein